MFARLLGAGLTKPEVNLNIQIEKGRLNPFKRKGQKKTNTFTILHGTVLTLGLSPFMPSPA
jgi:hypothetical protein